MDTINSITVRDFRCFAGSQTARIAPLTLLVGDNSSGKTSLMAMLRAMLDVAYAEKMPDFKEPPYDLGSFREIVHQIGARPRPPDRFGATLEVVTDMGPAEDNEDNTVEIDVDFTDYLSAPVPVRRRVSQGQYWVEQHFKQPGDLTTSYGSQRGTWLHSQDSSRPLFAGRYTNDLPPIDFALWYLWHTLYTEHDAEVSAEQVVQPLDDSPPISADDVKEIRENLEYGGIGPHFGTNGMGIGVFASAPVRSQPKRTYDPARATPDPEGDYVPMYLAQLALREPKTWQSLKGRLQEFGSQSGLFTEIDVRRLGKVESAPFHIRLRNASNQRKGPFRNLVDVGYGVSQVLPLITELLRHDGPSLMLLQQPEVHLHPSAAAALGSLFCEVVAHSMRDRMAGRQIVVETHSDFIIDRVRMAVRDKAAGLTPENVSILYFKREEQTVQIHSISVDRLGNIEGAPDGYRKFFMEELRRSMSA